MNISEKAKEYAEGKALNALTSAIEEAYADGYNAGYNDALENKEVKKPEDLDKSVEFVDLGLPSGTKWAADYLKDKDGNLIYLPYIEAEKLNIPTKEQYEELVKYCQRENSYSGDKTVGQILIGRNGMSIKYYYSLIIRARHEPMDRCRFWLKDDSNEDLNSRTVSDILDFKDLSPSHEYMGYKLPVIVVK